MALQPPARHIFRMMHPNFWINIPMLRHCCNGKGRPGNVEFVREMSSASNLATAPRRLPPYEDYTPPSMHEYRYTDTCIATLRPSQLKAKRQKILDLSGKQQYRISVAGSHRLRFFYCVHPLERFLPYVYPPNTRGVYYYYLRHDYPPVSGELRFRLCKSIDKFDKGRDLTLPDGLTPWSLSIYTISRLKRYSRIADLLVEEQLVDKELVRDQRRILNKRPQGQYPWISVFNQPFVLNLQKRDLSVALLSRHDNQLLRFQNIFWDPYLRISPYRGHIQVRFEFSNHMRHMQRTYVVLRVVDTLTPIECIVEKYDGYIAPPVPGTLFSKKHRLGIGYTSWAVPVDAGHGEDRNKAPLATFLEGLKEEGFKIPKPKFYVDLDDTMSDVDSQSEP
ncbi:hypothetical protein M413DRAFT_27576 [Hebeloma cylindrosporum]|uniref:Uncharacterized protein n=1 Tax=Hebeloma cylindrosporum TaxID=76867 RepID=A0A0C3CEI6_HEBCY|nr:hypothetical protein M413DRAFT_27576 [Hebeloma cylindrosporum h7]